MVCRYLGDVLLATPLAGSLRMAGYEVDWIVAPGTDGILEHQPCANRVTVVDPKMPATKQLGLAASLWRKYDLAFALPSTDRSMMLSLAASGSVHALIHANRIQETWKRYLAKRWVDYAPNTHMVALVCDLAASSNLPACRDVQIHWDEDDVRQVLSELPWPEDEPYIHLHPFARWPYKWWRKSAWRKLIQNALDGGFKVVMTAAPTEKEMAGLMAEGFPVDAVHVAAGRFNWRQLACLAHRAAAYVGLDTANTHLAAASGANVIALFGPTDPRIWGPWPNGFAGHTPWQASSEEGIQRRGSISLLQGRQDCVPCQLEGCERRQDSVSLCLKEMRADWVWQEVESRAQSGSGTSGHQNDARERTAI